MPDLDHCPNCDTDFVDEWLTYEATWIGDDVDASLECPECGWDLLNDVTPADALAVIEEGRGDG